MDGWNQVAYDLRTIALLNPRLALMLARGQPLAPRTYSIRLDWPQGTGVPGNQVENHLQDRMFQDAWIEEFVYSVRCPQANPGSLWKLQIDSYRKLSPYVNVEIRVEGPDRYEITNQPTALENICTTVNAKRSLLNRAWVITRDSNLYIRGYLDRTLNDDEMPYLVDLTINVQELSGCNLRSIGFQEAVCALRNMGLYPRE
jgi:hypothetical protein